MTLSSCLRGPVDFDSTYARLSLTEYWTYDCSFTMPHLTEAVDCYVLQNFAMLSRSQLNSSRQRRGAV